MRQSARSPEPASGLGELLREGLVLTGGTIARSPLLVGGTTAFIVTIGFVASNALWYQPHFHSGAFFETRSIIRIVPEESVAPQPTVRPQPQRVEQAPPPVAPERMAAVPEMPDQVTAPAPAARPNADSTVERVQRRLADLNLYTGQVDGLTGPQTHSAIAHYRRIVGLAEGEAIDAALLEQLGIADVAASENRTATDVTASIDNAPIPRLRDSAVQQVPVPAPSTTPTPTSGQVASQPPATDAPDPRIMRIQAGLRAFGNDGIEMDGRVGRRTRDALKEFQALFGLPETGQPDEVTYVKMREIGLAD